MQEFSGGRKRWPLRPAGWVAGTFVRSLQKCLTLKPHASITLTKMKLKLIWCPTPALWPGNCFHNAGRTCNQTRLWTCLLSLCFLGSVSHHLARFFCIPDLATFPASSLTVDILLGQSVSLGFPSMRPRGVQHLHPESTFPVRCRCVHRILPGDPRGERCGGAVPGLRPTSYFFCALLLPGHTVRD